MTELNKNPWIKDLLLWHGHDLAGVRVPFSERGGNPLRNEKGASDIIITGIVERLRKNAEKIASGEESPRWIFLVGGPGNGKSEAVQDFLSTLDHELECNGALIDILRKCFTSSPLVPWKAEISADTHELPGPFKEKVGRLIVIQDASATEQPNQDAARVLAEDILDLVTHPHPLPVFICCVNRGLLVRAIRYAHGIEKNDEVMQIIEGLIRATSLGKEVLSGNRPQCWPLDLPGHPLAGRIACWPMDMESMLLSPEEGGLDVSPVEQIINKAIAQEKWEAEDKCFDCSDLTLCPFYQNAAWLRNNSILMGLLKIFRRGELATGQRWNFRDTFSLVAEILVGEWGDFNNFDHPCDWVHSAADNCRDLNTQPTLAIESSLDLISRLYPNAIFPNINICKLPEEAVDIAEKNNCDVTIALSDYVATKRIPASTHIRGFLINIISPRLDPSYLSPHDEDHPIGKAEDVYNQSVNIGNDEWPTGTQMSTIEKRFFDLAKRAEAEWDPLSRESAQVTTSLRFLKTFCSSLAKKSIGVRLGLHANEQYLANYEDSIRDSNLLYDLTDALRSLLGEGGFSFNALESFGQPQLERGWVITLRGTSVPISPIIPAPISTGQPAHDFPFIEISDYPIPLTFDLYVALRLRKDGCTSSSLPSSVRAAIDRIRHLQAGRLCNEKEQFAQGSVEYAIKDHGKIILRRASESPILREGE